MTRPALARGMIAKVEVLESRAETPTTHVVRFARPKGFQYLPVQFCGLELATAEGGIEYPMSLASSPTREYLEFGARVASGTPWKRAFAALKPGDVAEVDGPYGHFVLDEARPAVFVAGGIGITPLKGMATYATDKGLPHPLALVYSNRTPEEIAYRHELDELAKANPRFRILHTITRPAEAKEPWSGRTGRLDAALLQEAAAGMRDPTYYVCGSPDMVVHAIGLLRGLGVPGARIAQERFFGY